MSGPLAISVDALSKRYRLGLTHAGSIRELVNGNVRKLLRRSNASSVDSDDRGENEFWALRDISLDVHAGEVVGMIGKNGAGKSTLLKVLSRITTPTSGRAVLHGRVASLLEVGTGFHPELTGRENIFLNGTILGMTRREVERRFDDIVDFAGISQFIDTPVKRYSSGMTVRLGFAVAAHLDPEILIVDEVLAVGDVEFQRRCLGKMREVASSGKTVLFVSHNLASIRSLTTRSVVLSKGTVDFVGSTADAVRRYVTLNANESESNTDVRDLARPFSGLSRELQFAALSIGSAEIDSRDDIEFTIGVERTNASVSECREFLVGLTIMRDDETAVGSTFSQSFTAPGDGELATIAMTIPQPSLAPGRYLCGVSIADARSAGHRIVDSLSNVLSFEVTSPEFGQRQWTSGWGAVQFAPIQSGDVLMSPAVSDQTTETAVCRS